MISFQDIFLLLLMLFMVSYACMIVAFTYGLVKIQKRQTSLKIQVPEFVSVIIPVRNEEGHILRILAEILIQDFPKNLTELIVTDDHSEDRTMALAGEFAAQHPECNLVLVTSAASGNDATGKKSAIERAVGVATGAILLFTDADTTRGPGWIAAMVSGFTSPGIRMVMGPVYFSGAQNLLQKIQSLEFAGLMGTTAGSAALGYPVMCNGANLAYRRSAFYETGGFREHIRFLSGDDQFMMTAIRKRYGSASLQFMFDKPASVGTWPEQTLKGFFNQRVRWVSKSKGYRDPVVIGVGAVTWLTHLLLLAGLLAGLVQPQILLASLFLWGLKILAEYPMVWLMTRFFGNTRLRGYYIIAQVFQLVYVPLAGLSGLFFTYRWKGRKG